MGTFATKAFRLANGYLLPHLEIAYETYGEMAGDRSNVILVTHGITSSHYAMRTPTRDSRHSWYAGLIGSGKLFDTDRFCVVSSNTLGSCYGSTSPASRNPSTGRLYGSKFPKICYEDIVRAQQALLTSLGIERLVAVAGSSIGGFQAFQWAVTFPDFMSAVLALDTATRDTFDVASTIADLEASFAEDPNWNG